MVSPEELLRRMVKKIEGEGKICIRVPEDTGTDIVQFFAAEKRSSEMASEALNLFLHAITSKGIKPDDVVLYSIGRGVLSLIKIIKSELGLHYIFAEHTDTPKPERIGIIVKNKQAKFTYGF